MKKRRQYSQSLNNYARYSGMAFQMVFIIALGVFGGVKLDKLADSNPWFTLICTLAGIAIAIYIAVKDALHSNSSNHEQNHTH